MSLAIMAKAQKEQLEILTGGLQKKGIVSILLPNTGTQAYHP
jgi:hypothetical protein